VEEYSAEQLIRWALATYGNRFAVCTSMQNEGLVLIDMACRAADALGQSVRVFTIDTGRLPQETYAVMDAVRSRYGIDIEIVAPDHAEIERMCTRFGVNLFYQDSSYRKLCCHVRKVRPLERKLIEFDAWATGLRREQSIERAGVPKAADVDGRKKLSPLADWTHAQVKEYMLRNNIAGHPLEEAGYTSIGCAPCTRAVQPGEDHRAGRWWWETEDSKECGIHVTPTGAMKRTLDVLLEDILVH
jgi:phosphoadenylyl-sulfate reductase (thioredoxin)